MAVITPKNPAILLLSLLNVLFKADHIRISTEMINQSKFSTESINRCN